MNPFAIAFFGLLWLSVLGGCLTTITGISGANIGPSRYCTTVGIKPYAAAGTITPLVNDSIVFFAISFRLSGNSWARRTLKNGVRVIVFGDYLPAFSKSMLQDGQVYFLSEFSHFILYSRQRQLTSFRQDHGHCQSFNSDHVICLFSLRCLSNDVHDSQCDIDEYYGVSSLSRHAAESSHGGLRLFFQSLLC